MRLVILANNDIGLLNFRKQLIQELLLSNQITIILPYGDRVNELIEYGCECVFIDIERRSIKPDKDFRYFMKLYHNLKKIRPDLVLSYTIKPNIYGSLVCRLLNVQNIVNITGLGTVFQKNGILKRFVCFLYKISIKKSTWVFIQNEAISKTLKKYNLIHENYSLLPGSGVDLKDYSVTSVNCSHATHFLFIGRLMKEKGINEFLEAACIIVRKYTDVYFDIVGMKDDELTIDSYLNENIKYHGTTKSPQTYYNECTCLINPSYHEGMSNVVLEACASGKPCLVSNIDGCKQIISDGIEGFLFEKADVASLVTSIEKFLALSNDERIQLGKNARTKVEKQFDRNIVTKMYIDKIHSMEVE